eukprot:1040324-Rhodomonas_salina.1
MNFFSTAHRVAAYARSVPDIARSVYCVAAYARSVPARNEPHTPCQYRTSHSTRVGQLHHTLGQYRTSHSSRVDTQQHTPCPVPDIA